MGARLTAPGTRDHVLAELLGYGFGTVHILSCGISRHGNRCVTYPCSRPGEPKSGLTCGDGFRGSGRSALWPVVTGAQGGSAQQVSGTDPLSPLGLEAVQVNSNVPPWEIVSVMLVTVRVGFTPVQFGLGHPA